jgi:hypothetical protein
MRAVFRASPFSLGSPLSFWVVLFIFWVVINDSQYAFWVVNFPFREVQFAIIVVIWSWSFVIFDFGNAVITHYNININIYIIVAVLTASFLDFDK